MWHAWCYFVPDSPSSQGREFMRGPEQLQRRHSIRLRGYDYAQPGLYFVTICTAYRECLLGEVSGAAVHLTRAGRAVAGAWEALPASFCSICLDAFVIMPNHVHGIICLQAAHSGPLGREPQRPPSLGQVVRAFKSLSARAANHAMGRTGQPLWQRNYYEHVIRNEVSLTAIRQYIEENPARWADDPENPGRLTS
jgi:putative transposase